MGKNSRLVYSTETGRVSTESDETQEPIARGDEFVRIRRETKGRGGKAVCVVEGLPSSELKVLSKRLKNACATGGAIKELTIEIQGDHRDKLKQLLEKDGYKVKLSGG